MLSEILRDLLSGHSLASEQAEEAFEAILAGADTHQAAALLAVLAMRGVQAEEVTGFVRAALHHQVSPPISGHLLDIVGTGGDQSGSVNLSTGSAIVAAACGARVAKHGNRAASSQCGSADVLEALGIDLEGDPEVTLERAGIAFLFCQNYHPAARLMGQLRKKLGFRTVLNFMGPLLNPAGAKRQVVGVYDPRLLELMALSLQELGSEHALVVHTQGMDEFSPIGVSEVVEVTPTKLRSFRLDPLTLGVSRCSLDDLRGGTAACNAELLAAALGGKRGPIGDALALSAGAGLYVYGLSKSLEEGFQQARESLSLGKPLETLQAWRACFRHG